MRFHATFQNLFCTHPFAPGKTPRSQVLVKHSLRIEIWSTLSNKSLDHPWWKGGRDTFQYQDAHQEPTKLFRLNWLLVTITIFQNRRILSVVERFKTQLIISLYQVVNTPTPGKKVDWLIIQYRVKTITTLFYRKNLIWQDTIIPERPQPCARISTRFLNNIKN